VGAAYAARRPGGVGRPAGAAALAVAAWIAFAQPLATALTPWHEQLAALPMLALLALVAAPLGVPFARLLVEWARTAPGYGPAAAWLGSGVGALAAGAGAIWAAHAWGTPSLALLALAAYALAALLQLRRRGRRPEDATPSRAAA
jgi:O-antigen/teichoic acid export membrane protein